MIELIMTELDQFQAQMIALTRAFGWHRPMSTPCGKPVSIADAHALLELSYGKPLSQNELAERLNLSKSTVSRLVTNQVKRGWVERQRNANDGRAVDLTLTKAGQKMAAEMAEARQKRMADILRELSAENLPQVQQSLRHLLEAIHAANKK